MTAKNVTATQLAAELARASRMTDKAMDRVVRAAAYAVREDAYNSVTRGTKKNDPAAYAARQISADPTGPGEMQIGYHNRVADLASKIEHGSVNSGPGGHLAAAAEREAPVLARVIPMAAMKAMRGS